MDEHLRRWRLILGGEANGSCGGLSGDDAGMDEALGALYGEDGGGSAGGQSRGLKGQGPRGNRGGSENSMPSVARWLGDIRKYFPSTVVQVMQRDAIERLNMRQLLLEPELLNAIQPDVHLVADLISLNKVMPNETRDTARQVVQAVVTELMRKLTAPMRQAIAASLNRAVRNYRPRHNEIAWQRTI